MRKIHHAGESTLTCQRCNKSLKMFWYDEAEQNGMSETLWSAKNGESVCSDCLTKENNGRPPLGLKDLKIIRQRGIAPDQYYKELGF